MQREQRAEPHEGRIALARQDGLPLLLGRVAEPFPAPHRTIFRIDHVFRMIKAALLQHPGGRVRCRQRVGANHPNLIARKGKLYQGPGRFGSVPPSFVGGYDGVGDLDHARLGRPGL